jgi:hypothetical protein
MLAEVVTAAAVRRKPTRVLSHHGDVFSLRDFKLTELKRSRYANLSAWALIRIGRSVVVDQAHEELAGLHANELHAE